MKRLISLITGTGGITLKLIVDILLAIVGRIAWPIIIERLLTRLIMQGLNWLKNITTNDVAQGFVDDIRDQLIARRLPTAAEKPKE